MLLVVSPDTVATPERLRTRQVPRKFLSIGVTLYPTGGPRSRLWWRVFFEKSLPRYLIVLFPFPALIIARPEWALALSQAPLLMFGLVLIVETYVLTVSTPEGRRKLIDPANAARALDLLQVRGTDLLTRIAAGRGLERGTLYLAVEQSGLIRVPPLTTIAVQQQVPEPGFLHLTAEEQTMLRDELFAEGLSEDTLRRANIAGNGFLRVVTLDVATISAHARLAAMAARA